MKFGFFWGVIVEFLSACGWTLDVRGEFEVEFARVRARDGPWAKKTTEC